jgi:5'-nucleotidase
MAKILVTNDDGIHAPGIRHLWKAMKTVGEVIVVAPSEERSATSLSITLRNPLKVDSHWGENNVWSVSGTPADCVKMALSVIMDSPPDLIVSGINRGSNAGRNALYSGTVAAAIEGALHDIPSIAFSCFDYFDPNYSAYEFHTCQIARYALNKPLKKGTVLNVNFPSKEIPYKGLKMTHQGREYWAENPDKRDHPGERHAYFWLGAKLAQFDEIEDCDISWLKQGFATVVPLQVNELTDREHVKENRDELEKFFL